MPTCTNFFVLENTGYLCYHVMDSLLFLDVLPFKLLFKNNLKIISNRVNTKI